MAWAFALLLVIFEMVGTLAESKTYQVIINRYFSDKYFLVKIGNKGGVEADFKALPYEEIKIKQLLEQFKLCKVAQTKTNVSNIEEIRKLSELFRDGIVTESEFFSKKKQLLSL